MLGNGRRLTTEARGKINPGRFGILSKICCSRSDLREGPVIVQRLRSRRWKEGNCVYRSTWYASETPEVPEKRVGTTLSWQRLCSAGERGTWELEIKNWVEVR